MFLPVGRNQPYLFATLRKGTPKAVRKLSIFRNPFKVWANLFMCWCALQPELYLMQENTSRPLSSTNPHLSVSYRCGLYLTAGQWAFLETCKNLYFENCSHWRSAQPLFLCCSHKFSHSSLILARFDSGVTLSWLRRYPVLGNSLFFSRCVRDGSTFFQTNAAAHFTVR